MNYRFFMCLLLAVVSCWGSIEPVQAAPGKKRAVKRSTVKKIRVDQRSKNAVMRTFIKALLAKNVDTLERIFSPGIKAMLNKQSPDGKYQSLLPKMIDSLHKSLCKEYKIKDPAAAISNNALIDKIIKDGDKQTGGKCAVQIKGKWYVSLGMDNSAESQPGKGFADQRAAATAFVDAVLAADSKALFDTFSPEAQASLEKKFKRNKNKFKNRDAYLKSLINQMHQRMLKEFKLKSIDEIKRNKSVKEDVVRSMFKGPNPPFKEINGRWYVNFSM